MDLLNYLKDELISFTVHRKTISIDSDGVQSESLSQVASGSGDLQPVDMKLRRAEPGLDILGTHVLYAKGVDIKVNDEIHVIDKVYQVISVLDLKDYLEVHCEIRD
ncbi:MAG: hypothetical protein GX452_04430 [Ignavibacteriales bacterium]|nr:hypothetical protein [Ignavibacteriales bacterium]